MRQVALVALTGGATDGARSAVKFLLDHDVPEDLTYLLQELGHDVAGRPERRFSTTHPNPDPPPATTDCRPFVSRMPVRRI
jgi:hypothetical protein